MPTTKKPGFTEDEKTAMQARAEELRSSGRGGARKADEAQACLDAIEAMPDEDRVLAQRVHTLVGEVTPSLRPKTWYGMYATFGFTDSARLDDGELWPTEFAVVGMPDAVVDAIRALLARAVPATD